MPPKPPDTMGVSTQAVCSNLDVFLAMCKSEHFILYLPYDGQMMLEFLDSCFHRDFMRHVGAWGFREVAVFTETASLGRIFLLLSRSSPDECPFGLENSTALQNSGVFSRAFSIESTGLLPCHAVESNTLLVRQDAFYQPDKMAGRCVGEADENGAQTLLMYTALRNGLYDVKKHMYLAQPRSHESGSMKTPCTDRPELCITPDLADLLSPPWNRPYTGIYKMLPYMVLNILTSELGNMTSKTHSNSHDPAYPFGVGTGTPVQTNKTTQPTTPLSFPRTAPSLTITPSTTSSRSTPKPPPPASGPTPHQSILDRLTPWEPLQAAIDRLKSVISASRDGVRHLLYDDGSDSSESDTPEPIGAGRSGKKAGAAVVGSTSSFPTHQSALDADRLRKLMGPGYEYKNGQAEELGHWRDDVWEAREESGSDSSSSSASGDEGINIAPGVKTAAVTRDRTGGLKDVQSTPEKGGDETAQLDSLASEDSTGKTVPAVEVSKEGANAGGAKARRRRPDNGRRKEKKRQRAAGDQETKASLDNGSKSAFVTPISVLI